MLHKTIEYALLGAIVIGYLVMGGLYAVQTPAWQAPDEPAHYNYIRQIGAGGCCPVIEMGDWDSAYLRELTTARFDPALTAQLDTIQYEDHQPPLYYIVVSAVLFALDFLDDVLVNIPGDGLTQARLLSVLMGAGVVVCAYAIGRVTFPQRRGVALGAAALVAFIPQHAAILGSVNNDALAFLLAALTLLVCAHYLSLPPRAPLIRWQVAMGVLVGLAFLTKSTVYFLVFIVPLAIALRPFVLTMQGTTGHAAGTAVSVAKALKGVPGVPDTVPRGFRRRLVRTAREVYAPVIRRTWRGVLRGWALALAIALALGALWWVRNSVVYGFPDILALHAHDEVVVGQLRTAGRIENVGGFGAYLQSAVQTTFNSFWGQLGWMALPLPGWAYRRILYLLVGALAGLVFDILWMRAHKQQPTARHVAIGGLLALAGVFALAAFVYYNTQFYQPQGRYLFTALIPFALLVALGVDAWARALGRLVGAEQFAAYLTPLVLAVTFGAFNLWLIRFILPSLAPV